LTDCTGDRPAESPVSALGGHGFLTDFGKPNLTLTAQGDVAAFFTLPDAVQPPPIRSSAN
jgi:hypothetical protein